MVIVCLERYLLALTVKLLRFYIRELINSIFIAIKHEVSQVAAAQVHYKPILKNLQFIKKMMHFIFFNPKILLNSKSALTLVTSITDLFIMFF